MEAPKLDTDNTDSLFPEQLTGAEGSERIVTQWLDRLQLEHVPIKEGVDGYSWVLLVTDSSDDRFLVGWRQEWGALQTQTELGLEKPHQDAYLMLSATDKLVFLSSLGASLSKMALEHSVVPRVSEGEEIEPMNTPPEKIIIFDTLLVDRPRYCSDFLSRYLRVRGARSVAGHMVNRMAMLRRWG